MRLMMIPIATIALGACTTGPEQMTRSESDQRVYDKALAGKIAGKAESCLPTYRSNDMTVVDDHTILFREGRTTWVNSTLGRCSSLGNSGYALVTRNFNSQLCRGDIATVTDVSTGMTVGSCALGDFVPYRPTT